MKDDTNIEHSKEFFFFVRKNNRYAEEELEEILQ